MRKVFTFWEPKGNVPGYVRLCMKTWGRCLPDCEIVVLDFKSLGEWLTEDEVAEIRCPQEPLAQQADCVRCALLKKHGGIWLDADTILTKPLSARFMSSDVTMVARREGGRLVNYGAYICAVRPATAIVAEWHRQLLPRVIRARALRGNPLNRLLHRREWKSVRRWDYFENAILDPITAAAPASDYGWVDKDGIGAFPEETLLASGGAANAFDAYVRYWFSPGDPGRALADCAGIIMLHNSWTPARFRAMSESEFLATDTRLAALLSSYDCTKN